MPKGIILSSGSEGATEADVQKVLEQHGYEVEKPATAVATEEAGEELEAGEQLEEEELAPEPTRRRNRTQKVIEKETAPLKAEVKKLQDELKALKKPEQEPAKPAKLEAPKREDFKSDEEFDEAKFQYRYQLQRQKEQDDAANKQREEAVKAQEAERQEHWKTYQANGEKFKAEHPDWDEVVGNDDIKITQLAYEIIVRLENPAVTYYIASHPEFQKKLLGLDPFLTGVELERLNSKLLSGALKPGASASEPSKKPIPPLPEPVKPVRTSAVSSTLTTADAAKRGSYKDFKRAARAQAR